MLRLARYCRYAARNYIAKFLLHTLGNAKPDTWENLLDMYHLATFGNVK